MRWQALQNAPCSIARSLAIVGERWTLLILRECFQGARRFDEFRERLGIARNVLAGRLQELVAHGVLEKVAYQNRPRRFEYRLTAKGQDLYPVLVALMAWGDRWLSEGGEAPLTLIHRGCGRPVQAALVCAECGEPLEPANTRARIRAPLLAAARPD